jgi:hypothetical protein
VLAVRRFDTPTALIAIGGILLGFIPLRANRKPRP